MIPFETLTELFSIATEPWGYSSWYRAATPTRPSIERIQHELGITIPEDFVRLAKACPSYGGWLASIGRDYKRPVHILNLNKSFHAAEDGCALPRHLILLNHGHDGHCDCWDAKQVTASGELRVVYIGLDSPRPKSVQSRFNSFRDYIEHFVLHYAPRTPNLAQRRRAKRLIQKYDHAA